ncbi:MAG TPA: CHRD domain-containing protein [Gammaproteobacteria bacterium]|nr:CHRD domain-containing protein [Gammaproteobacteria bacterium]
MNTLLKMSMAAVLAASVSPVFAGDEPPEAPEAPEGLRFTFAATLSGAQAGAITDATGDVTLDFANDLSSATYTLNTLNTGTITAAHFHCAAAGVDGPPAVNIEVGTFTITNEDIRPIIGNAVCGVTINNIASLLNATLQGVIYANIHTDLFPAGELRGQIFTPNP